MAGKTTVSLRLARVARPATYIGGLFTEHACQSCIAGGLVPQQLYLLIPGLLRK
jgi:hypothetical protein